MSIEIKKYYNNKGEVIAKECINEYGTPCNKNFGKPCVCQVFAGYPDMPLAFNGW